MIKLKNWPTDSRRITSTIGPRWGDFHDGVDIGALKQGVEGDKLNAVADGIVVISKVNGGGVTKGYGYYIAIQHDGFCTLYGHMQGLALKVGQTVKAGQIIGHMGNTGTSTAAHLHFRLIEGNIVSYDKDESGKTKGSVNPEPFLREINDKEEEKVAEVKPAAQKVAEWAEDAQEWVKDNEISDGSRRKDPVTREELWTMLYRAKEVK